jgi:hypothetical protein
VERVVRGRRPRLPGLRRRAAEPGRARCASATTRSPTSRRCRWTASSASSPAETRRPRADIARDMVVELRSRSAFLARSASATWRWTAPRRRCRAARRSASGSPRSSAPTCRASATSSTSRPSACIRATTHPARHAGSCAAKGNTLLVVEHDEDTIRRADHVLDLGPGAGTLGGRVVAEGTAKDLMRHPESITGRCLAQPLRTRSRRAARSVSTTHRRSRSRRATCTT